MYFDDFKTGDTFHLNEVKIKRKNMLEFAEEYDPQPIHLDDDYGSASKFGDIIAPGIMSFMSVWAEFVKSNIITDNFIAAQNFRINWISPVFSNDVLTGEVKIGELTPRNAYNGIVEVNLAVYNQQKQKVMDTTTEAILKRRPKNPSNHIRM